MFRNAILKTGGPIIIGSQYTSNGEKYYHLPDGNCIKSSKVKTIIPSRHNVFSPEMYKVKNPHHPKGKARASKRSK